MKKKTTTRKTATKKAVKRAITKAPKKTAGKTTKKTTCTTSKNKTAPKTTAKTKATAKNNVTKAKKTTTKTAVVPKKKNEFRKNKKTGHPAYIYQKVGNDYKYIGITHAPVTQKTKNIKLEENPNPEDKRTAYARPKTKTAKTKFFGAKKPKWKVGEKDKEKINTIIKKSKN